MSDTKKPAKSISVTGGDDDAAKAEAPESVVITKRAILKAPTTAPPLDGNSTDAAAEPPQAMAQSIKKPLKPLIQPLKDSPEEPAKIEVASNKPAEPDAKTDTPADEPTGQKPDEDAEADKPAGPKPADDADKPAETPPAPPADEPAEDEPDEATTTEGAEGETKKGGPTEEEQNAEAEAKAKHDEAIQKMVDSRQYFLPINAVEKRKTKHFVLLGLFVSLLLVLAWGDIALDAGLIQIPGVKPVTHFFSN